jgi:hypothetical protein
LDGVSKAAVEAPRWEAHNTSASRAGRSLAKLWTKMFLLRYSVAFLSFGVLTGSRCGPDFLEQ